MYRIGMKATIVDNQVIKLSSLSPPEEAAVAENFSVALPEYIRRKFAGGGPDDNHGPRWDGVYRRYDRKHQTLARPFLAELKRFCDLRGFPLDIVDAREPVKIACLTPEQVTSDLLPGITLEAYQLAGIRKACGIGPDVECGIFSMTTGSGKSEIAAALCRIRRCSTVILAEQKIVIDQLKERLELRCIAEEVGLFYAGKTPNGQLVIVGSVQSLQAPRKAPARPVRKQDETDAKWNERLKRYGATIKGMASRVKRAKVLRQLVRAADMLIIDECDLASSKMYSNIFRFWFRGRYRYGLTGTINDPARPYQNLKVMEHLGSVLHHVERLEVEATGRIVPVEIFMVAVGDYRQRNDRSTFDLAIEDFVITNQEFHDLVKRICERYPDDGTLVLVERNGLGTALQMAIPASVYINGKTKIKDRNAAIAAFEARHLKVLIGGKIIKRGLDLHGGCENLIIATNGKLWSKLIQETGRALRVNKRGRSRVFGFLHLSNHYLYDHGRRHIRYMIDLGYPVTVLLEDRCIDGEAFLSKGFRWQH